jgi:hypothetical protein
MMAPASTSAAARENGRAVYGPTELPRPRAACPPASDGEIEVCAPVPVENEKYRLGSPLPPSPTAMEELARKLRWRVGPLEFTPHSVSIKF